MDDANDRGGVQAEGAGETVGEARWAALRALEQLVPHLDREAVEYQVLSEGERGLMGVGRQPAKVLARAPEGDAGSPLPSAPAPASVRAEPLSPEAERARLVVERVASAVDTGFRVSVEERDGAIEVTVAGPSAALLIGHHGHTIDALQHLVEAILFPAGVERRPVVVDAQGYRSRRERSLREMADRAAASAVREGRDVALEPMSSAERKVVHLALAEREDVETASEGREPTRFVVVRPSSAA